MPSATTKYFMGDIYVADVGFGFLVSDRREGETEITINEETARAIVDKAEGDPNATLNPANLFEISKEEFELFRDTEINSPGLPDGVRIWQVKR